MRNRNKAWLHFYPKGKGYAKPSYVLHHDDINLKESDPERYDEWNIDDLVMMSRSEHNILHNTGNHMLNSSKQKSSLSLIGSKSKMARKVLCITTGEVFDCIKYAGEKYNTACSGIIKSCKGILKTSGKLSNGTKLRWKYVD